MAILIIYDNLRLSLIRGIDERSCPSRSKLASAVLFCLFIYLIVSGSDKGQYITVAAVLVFAVLCTRLEDITNVNFGATGVKAELERKLREAQATVTQLQRIAELFGQISVQQISMSNRWGGLSSSEKREAIQKIEGELRAIKIPDDRIEKVLLSQRNYDRHDYFYWVTQAIPSVGTQTQLDAFTNFSTAFPNVSVDFLPSTAAVEEYLKQHNVTGGEAIERLTDWKQYERDYSHRRVEIWDHRHDLPK
jgi:hypothetical protein